MSPPVSDGPTTNAPTSLQDEISAALAKAKLLPLQTKAREIVGFPEPSKADVKRLMELLETDSENYTPVIERVRAEGRHDLAQAIERIRHTRELLTASSDAVAAQRERQREDELRVSRAIDAAMTGFRDLPGGDMGYTDDGYALGAPDTRPRTPFDAGVGPFPSLDLRMSD